MPKNKNILILFMTTLLVITVSCSSTKYLKSDEYLLKSTKVYTDSKDVTASQLDPYIQQHPNSKWFSLFKIPLGIYNMSGSDSAKWINRTLRRLGEAPVVYDSLKSVASCNNIVSAMNSMGYLDASATMEVVKKKKKATVKYTASPNRVYTIDSVAYLIEDASLIDVLQTDKESGRGLKRGMVFSLTNLENERKRIAQLLINNGYYRFNKEFIRYEVDSLGKNGKVDVCLRLIKYRASNNSPETAHQQYHINNVNFVSGNANGRIPLRRHVLETNTLLKKDSLFRASDLQKTYNNFSRLQAVKFTNIHFDETPDTALLNCTMQLSTRKPNSISFQPEGTNTAGDFGAAASLTFENNNIFRGSELLSIQFRGAFEAIKGLEGYQNQNYVEYNVETKLSFPRIIAPFVSKALRHKSSMQSELLFSYNLQNRPEFHRRVLAGAWRYRWKDSPHNMSYRFDLIDINYVHMPWISSTFKSEYLDNASNRNAILRYNYEDLFILITGLNFTYNDGLNAFRSNIELGGNLLNGLSHAFGNDKNADGQYTLFNIAYAQYVKGDFDFTRIVNIDSKNTFVAHIGAGVAYPYGNSKILPFEKRYFSGGANSVRGWNVRELGPGKFKGNDGRIDFINQTGDIKLDINAELRTFLFWKFNGAAFIDAGNIWTIRNYKDQPDGAFKFNEFYKQIAVSYGLGLRLNFDYFIMRLDLGIKAINPVYETRKEHYPIIHPKLGRDLSLHFAVGMPF